MEYEPQGYKPPDSWHSAFRKGLASDIDTPELFHSRTYLADTVQFHLYSCKDGGGSRFDLPNGIFVATNVPAKEASYNEEAFYQMAHILSSILMENMPKPKISMEVPSSIRNHLPKDARIDLSNAILLVMYGTNLKNEHLILELLVPSAKDAADTITRELGR